MSDLVEICVDGLFAVETGHGTPIILLHGGLANHLVCRAFAAPLMSSYRVITPDLRGSGKSTFSGELSWDLLADDIAALVRHLGLATAVIGGVSFGSGVAVRTALRHPGLVDKLVLLTPAFAGTDVGLTPAQDEAMRAMDAVGSRAVAEGIEVIFPLFDRLPPDVRERIRRIAALYDPASVATSTRFMASGAQPFASASELAAISAPTLVVPGTDPYHPAEFADLYARHLPHCIVRNTTNYAEAIAELMTSLA
jgi:pimeloyl-ACP methyl ester carboxylesterase